jgi:hypothetical protein
MGIPPAVMEASLHDHHLKGSCRAGRYGGGPERLGEVVVRRSRLDFCRAALVAVPFHIVVLAPGPAVAWRRNQAREKVLATDWSPLDEAMRSELGQQGIWSDNAAQTIDETVEAILSVTGPACGSEIDQPLR